MEPSKPRRRPSHLPPITRELVFSTCDQLKGAKKSVTNQAVRDILGGGSYLTISPWVREWQDQEDQRFRLSLIEIPESVEEAAMLAAQQIWKAASDLASQQLMELGKKMQEMEAEHLRREQEYHGEISALEAEREGLAAERDSAISNLQEKSKEVDQIRSDLTDKSQKLTVALLRESELDRQKHEIEKELKATRDDAAKIGKDFMKAEALLEMERTDRERAEARLTSAQQAVKELTDQASSLQNKLATEQQKLAVEQQKNRGLAEQALHLKEQLETEQDNNTKNRQILHDLELLHKQSLEDYRNANIAAIQRAENAESEAGQYQDIANRMTDRIEELQKEKDRITLLLAKELDADIERNNAAKEAAQKEGSRKTSKKGATHATPPNP